MTRLKEWAVVTGASGGIGREFARLFAASGVNVVLASRDKNALQKVAKELQNKGVETIVYEGDLSESSASKGLVDLLKSKKISVQYLINNAGFGDYGRFVDGDWAKQQSMINLNISTLTYLTKEIGSNMQKIGSGKILNVASTAAFFPGPLMAVYYATKAYVLRFSVAINNEFKGTGVTVTALCPGPTITHFAETAKANRAGVFRSKNLPTAEEVAKFGYAAMLSGKSVAVHGTQNKILTFLSRILPINFTARLVRKAQS